MIAIQRKATELIDLAVPPDCVLNSGDRLIVLATRSGLGRVLARSMVPAAEGPGRCSETGGRLRRGTPRVRCATRACCGMCDEDRTASSAALGRWRRRSRRPRRSPAGAADRHGEFLGLPATRVDQAALSRA